MNVKYWKSVLVSVLLLSSASFSHGQNLGRIDFPTSGLPQAHKHFIEGVLFLHNFEYEDALEQFQKAEQIDPDFAMAYWGQAMCANHPLWRTSELAAAREVLQRLGDNPEARLAKAPTEREKGYLRAVEALFGPGDKSERDRAYHEAMRRLHEAFPDDLEATAFYSLSFLGLTDGTRDFRNYMQAGALAEEVFAKNPQHPGAAHYMIHSYDDPIHAPLGLRPARVYAKIAPAASHAQHMVSHIFVAMGMWEEVVKANETSFEVADRRVEKKGLGIDDRNFHALLWLHYAYLQQGRLGKARKVLEMMDSDTRKSGSERTRRHLAFMRASHAVDAPDKTLLPSLEKVGGLGEDPTCANLFASALSAFKQEKVGEVEKLSQQIDGCGSSPGARIMGMQVKAVLALEDERQEQALKLLREASAIEDEMPFSFGPPFPPKPAHELLGQVLFKLGRADEALTEFQKSLERAPGRSLSLLGLARAAAKTGNHELAAESYRQLRGIWHAADPDWPWLEETQPDPVLPSKR